MAVAGSVHTNLMFQNGRAEEALRRYEEVFAGGFTIDELDPKHGYSFTLTASQGGVESNTYMVLLAPETIGPPGQSILPSTRVLTPQGALVASTLSASTTPAPMSASVEPLLLLAIVAVAACVIVGTRLLGRIRQ